MHTEQSELITVMRENNIRHQELHGKYRDLRQRRSKAEALMSDGSINVAVSRMQTESNHTRQMIWYILTFLTLILFSKFAVQGGKSATNLSSTVILTMIVILFSIVTATHGGIYTYSGIPTLMSMIISLVVILYVGLYLIHR